MLPTSSKRLKSAFRISAVLIRPHLGRRPGGSCASQQSHLQVDPCLDLEAAKNKGSGCTSWSQAGLSWRPALPFVSCWGLGMILAL